MSAPQPRVSAVTGGGKACRRDDERRRLTTNVDVAEPPGLTHVDKYTRDKYDGARPFRQRKTSTESLNSIRCSILSQCSSTSKLQLITYVCVSISKAQMSERSRCRLTPKQKCTQLSTSLDCSC